MRALAVEQAGIRGRHADGEEEGQEQGDRSSFNSKWPGGGWWAG